MRMPIAFRAALLSFSAAALLFFALGVRGVSDDGLDNSSEPRGAGRRAIEQVLLGQQDAWNAGDIDKFVAGYWRSPELTFSSSSGVERGWDGVLARYKRHYASREAMGRLEFSGLEFRFLGPDAALVLGRWHLTRPPRSHRGPPANDAGGVFSLVFERFPEGWRIIHDHTSEVPGKN